MSESMSVFNRQAVRQHRDRAAGSLDDYDFLFQEVADRLADRLEDFARSFPLALDLGCHTGQLGRALKNQARIETLIQSDFSTAMATRAGKQTIVADEEALPFGENTFDAIFSCLSLHWVNDLPGALAQIRRALKPDGLFLAAMFGGETLRELRAALTHSELTEAGGAHPRVSPFADVRDAGGLLQRAGFALPVADMDDIAVSYADPVKLMTDLRGMGETNAVAARALNFTRPATLMGAAAHYRDLFEDSDGRVPATFQVIFLTAWAPHASQQQPLKRGTATNRLSDALDTDEIS
jgi:NADH dehydrogenase [ubiquinone] 1 alpha subcomplex assembly factor 5